MCTVFCLHVYAAHVWLPEEDTESLGTGVTVSCELPWDCWELDLSSLQEQQMFLNTTSPHQYY